MSSPWPVVKWWLNVDSCYLVKSGDLPLSTGTDMTDNSNKLGKVQSASTRKFYTWHFGSNYITQRGVQLKEMTGLEGPLPDPSAVLALHHHLGQSVSNKMVKVFHTITPRSQDLLIHKPSQLPRQHTALVASGFGTQNWSYTHTSLLCHTSSPLSLTPGLRECTCK